MNQNIHKIKLIQTKFMYKKNKYLYYIFLRQYRYTHIVLKNLPYAQ
jgi:hypothetical protein